MADYDIGDRPSKVAVFATAAGVATNPTGVHVKYRAPGSATVTTYTAPDSTLTDDTVATTGRWVFTPPVFAAHGVAYGTFYGLVGGIEVAEPWKWPVRRTYTA